MAGHSKQNLEGVSELKEEASKEDLKEEGDLQSDAKEEEDSQAGASESDLKERNSQELTERAPDTDLNNGASKLGEKKSTSMANSNDGALKSNTKERCSNIDLSLSDGATSYSKLSSHSDLNDNTLKTDLQEVSTPDLKKRISKTYLKDSSKSYLNEGTPKLDGATLLERKGKASKKKSKARISRSHTTKRTGKMGVQQCS